MDLQAFKLEAQGALASTACEARKLETTGIKKAQILEKVSLDGEMRYRDTVKISCR